MNINVSDRNSTIADLEQARKEMILLPEPEEGCPTVQLGMDFYSLALYTFYFASQEEKTDDQIVTDFDIKKMLTDKSFSNRFKSIDNATEVLIEHE